MSVLATKRIVLGVTGSIAAYKSADLVRRLREQGAEVRVVMTDNAKRFITPLTMQAVSGYPVHDDLFDLQAEAAMGHIALARWADLILVAPATADFMTRLATGHANDLLTTLCLATNAPIAIAPAMNQGMWHHALTQTHVAQLRAQSVILLGPAAGSQACGDIGMGRMLDPADIITELMPVFATGALAGVQVVITAGPTQEALDPVRYLSNHSSGKMGYALAAAAQNAGANVTLISGPVSLPPPEHVQIVHVVSAADMQAAVMAHMVSCQIFISVAAVADYRPQNMAAQKLHKTQASLDLALVRTPDIVANVAQLPNKPFIVGFAAETEEVIAQAKAKRQRKRMDLIIANEVGPELGMGTDDNAVTVIGTSFEMALARAPKMVLARQLIEIIAEQYHLGTQQKKS